MKQIKKVKIVTFQIASYGGIIDNVEQKCRALKELDIDVDLIFITANKTESESTYKSKVAKLEKGENLAKTEGSQQGGYWKSPWTGYWVNAYYGWLLPPVTNSIPIFHPNSIEMFYNAIKGTDMIIWNFLPTKQREFEGLDYWPKFFDLPLSIKQVFCVHDGYFDVRNSWVTAIRKKIDFLSCAHLAAFNSCSNISIPRILQYNARVIPDEPFVKPMSKRPFDFISFHIFKTNKKIDEFIRAIPHLKNPYKILMAGSGIEYFYMTSKDKCKGNYIAQKKDDPDLPDGQEGIPIWRRAVDWGMKYLGLISKEKVEFYQKSAKFAVDSSYCKHYANHTRTHINGFIIEAMINGCYPIIRDYNGLGKKEVKDDVFNEIRAVKIPWDATPKQFAKEMEKAAKMGEDEYLEGILNNFLVLTDYYDVRKQMIELVTMCEYGYDDLVSPGKDSEEVKRNCEKVMREFFKIELPIEWKNGIVR